MTARARLSQSLLWAIFLGVSWTWCIGMYLPVILVRQFGLWGWIVFAVPNVLGAAAMGWVLRTADSSRKIVADHGAACRAFSAVTISFQIFFLMWIAGWVGGHVGNLPTLIVAAVVGFLLGRGKVAVVGSCVVLVVSMGILSMFVRNDWIGALSLPVSPSPADLVGLAAVCLLGFALCPYLDLTFHRARQATGPLEAGVAFTLGFGLFFLTMILFTLGYCGWLMDWRMAIPPLLTLLLSIHLAMQCGYTIALHSAALGRDWKPLAAAFALAAIVFCFPGGETGYRFFMSFYGLIFPAYVWIVIAGRKRIELLAAAVIAAAPFLWVGFIGDGRLAWSAAGVAIVLLAPLFPAFNRPAYNQQG